MKLARKLGFGLLPLLAVIVLAAPLIALVSPAQIAAAAPTPVNASGTYGGNTVTVSCIGNLGYGSYSSVASMVSAATGTPPTMLTSFLFDIANSTNPPDNAFMYVASQLTNNPGASTGYIYFSPAPGETDSHAADICMRSGLYFSRPDNRWTFVGFEYNNWSDDNPAASARSGLEGNTNNDLDREFFSFGQGLTMPSRGVTRIELSPTGELVNDPYFSEVDSGYEDWLNVGGLAPGEEDNSCESTSGPLGWIMCPVAGLLDSITGWLDDQIQSLLTIKEDYFSGEGGEALKKAWARIRDIAYILLIPTALIMVLGTALGFEVFSAYTVKKALPRMVIAVIFITFSWYICTFLIDFTNVVGAGVKGLITFPFQFEGEGLRSGLKGALDMAGVTTAGAQGDASGLAEIGTVGIGLVGLGALFAGFFSIGIIMSMLFSAAVILGIAFIVLVARQMFILALVFLAPLAILAWIFPGNDKPWKLWWLAFTRLLLMFPLIMAIIGVGEVFAYVAGAAGSGGNLLFTSILVVAAVIVPYLFIPFTFKFAGGVFANLAGMVNDREKGLLDRGKKKRAEDRAALKERAGNNNRWAGNNALSRFGNKAASWGASPLANTAYYGRKIPGLRTKGEAIKSSIEGAASAQTGKLFEELNEKYKFNDRAYRALSGAHHGLSEGVQMQLRDAGMYGSAPKSAAEINKMAQILSTSSNGNERIAGNVMAGATGRLASLYSDPEMGKASVQAAGILGLAAHGFADGKDLATVGNSMIQQGYSESMAQSFINSAQVAGQRQRPDIKAGYGTVFEGGQFIDGMSPEGDRARSLIKTLSSGDLATAKAGSIATLATHIETMYREGGGEAQAVKDQLINWAGPYSQASVAVKTESLAIIDRLSGPKGNYQRTVRGRHPQTGQPMDMTENYYGYAPGTIGADLERRTASEADPATRGQAGGPEQEEA